MGQDRLVGVQAPHGGRPAKWWALGLSLGDYWPAVSSAVVTEFVEEPEAAEWHMSENTRRVHDTSGVGLP